MLSKSNNPEMGVIFDEIEDAIEIEEVIAPRH